MRSDEQTAALCTDRQADRERQTDRQRDRQTDRETDRQTERERQTDSRNPFVPFKFLDFVEQFGVLTGDRAELLHSKERKKESQREREREREGMNIRHTCVKTAP